MSLFQRLSRTLPDQDQPRPLAGLSGSDLVKLRRAYRRRFPSARPTVETLIRRRNGLLEQLAVFPDRKDVRRQLQMAEIETWYRLQDPRLLQPRPGKRRWFRRSR